jgi:hypothetical protein
VWLNVMTPDEMLPVTSSWIDPKGLRTVFLSIAEIAAQMPHVEEAHNALLAAAAANAGTDSAFVHAIEAAEKTVDKRFDHAARALMHLGICYREYMLASDPPNTDEASHAQLVMSELLPLKGKLLSMNYKAEAGATQVASTFLQGATDHQQLLSTMHITDKVSGLDLAHFWFDLGTKLDSLETEKTGAAASATKSVNMSTVRNDWIAIVRTVADNLQHTKAPASAVEQILAPVNQAAALATQRIAARRRNKLKKTTP